MHYICNWNNILSAHFPFSLLSFSLAFLQHLHLLFIFFLFLFPLVFLMEDNFLLSIFLQYWTYHQRRSLARIRLSPSLFTIQYVCYHHLPPSLSPPYSSLLFSSLLFSPLSLQSLFLSFLYLLDSHLFFQAGRGDFFVIR